MISKQRREITWQTRAARVSFVFFVVQMLCVVGDLFVSPFNWNRFAATFLLGLLWLQLSQVRRRLADEMQLVAMIIEKLDALPQNQHSDVDTAGVQAAAEASRKYEAYVKAGVAK